MKTNKTTHRTKNILKFVFLLVFGFQISIHTCNSQCDPHQATSTLNEKATSLLAGKNITYPFTFAIIADAHNYITNNELNPEYLKILGDIESKIQNSEIDFVINLGDFIQTGDEHSYFYEDICSWMNMTNVPFFSVAGNHDTWYGNQVPNYNKYISPKQNHVSESNFQFDYYFIVQDFLFLLTDNFENGAVSQNDNEPSFELAQISGYQTWIDIFIKFNSNLNILSFSHIPIIQSLDNEDQHYPNINYFYDNILINKKVRAHFSGHKHNYKVFEDFSNFYEFRLSAAGLKAPGSEVVDFEECSLQYPVAPYKYDNAASWLKVTVYENKSVKTELHYLNNTTCSHDQNYDFIIPETKDILINQDNTVGLNTTINYSTWETITKIQNKSFTIQGNGSTGANCIFEAAKKINIYPGFYAQRGSHFTAKIKTEKTITYCSSTENKSTQVYDSENDQAQNILENDQDVKIYPNPGSGYINIEFNSLEDKALVEVYNLMGNKVLSEFCSNTKLQLDISSQPKGIYIIKLFINNRCIVHRIINE